jgi:ribonuclease T1
MKSALRKLGLAFIGAAVVCGAAFARPAPADSASVALADLPAEARQTEQLIKRGGPFPYAKDGSMFGNRERLLPRQPRGYYREYTVKTPGSRDRGARRIVCGGDKPAAPQACYYTADHYASFKRIAP